uniref:Active regulator of SIRT1 n=1 Tax=Ailuropoda melanoleuca TaxID=9646 RepID=A0A7N5JP19_AILME
MLTNWNEEEESVGVWPELSAATALALLQQDWELRGAVEAPEPGKAKPSRALVKRTRKTNATQAQKRQNSAKGKVPKSVLADLCWPQDPAKLLA